MKICPCPDGLPDLDYDYDAEHGKAIAKLFSKEIVDAR